MRLVATFRPILAGLLAAALFLPVFPPPHAAADAAADIFSVYAIAAEAKTTGAEETATILVYRTGEFNENRVGLGGESTPDQNRDVLACKGIFLKKSQKA